jgi:hypothetical protein
VRYLVLLPLATGAAVLAVTGRACVMAASEMIRFIESRV